MGVLNILKALEPDYNHEGRNVGNTLCMNFTPKLLACNIIQSPIVCFHAWAM